LNPTLWLGSDSEATWGTCRLCITIGWDATNCSRYAASVAGYPTRRRRDGDEAFTEKAVGTLFALGRTLHWRFWVKRRDDPNQTLTDPGNRVQPQREVANPSANARYFPLTPAISCAIAGLDSQLRTANEMTQAIPLQVANMAQNMARSAQGQDSIVFQKVALVCMGVMALASVASVVQPLLRDLNRKHSPENARRR
jgi:hypothetical protein